MDDLSSYYTVGQPLDEATAEDAREDAAAKARAYKRAWRKRNRDKENARKRREYYAKHEENKQRAQQRKKRCLVRQKQARKKRKGRPPPPVPKPMWVRVRLGGQERHLWVLTPGRLARDLQFSKRTLRRWIRRGIVPAPKIRYGHGKGWRVYTLDEAQIIADVLESHFERAKTGRVMRIHHDGMREHISMLWPQLRHGVKQ